MLFRKHPVISQRRSLYEGTTSVLGEMCGVKIHSIRLSDDGFSTTHLSNALKSIVVFCESMQVAE